jgi:hypothetical protein
MAYQLQAILGSKHPLQTWCDQYNHAKLIPLYQNLYLVPFTDDLYDEINQFTKSPEITGFFFLNTRIASLLKNLSHSTSSTIAYVESEYFGGTGEENAIVWENGDMVYKEQGVHSAVNRALKQLGVIKDEQKDEFDTVGLGNNRDTIDWISEL